jgi:hypothetical protein
MHACGAGLTGFSVVRCGSYSVTRAMIDLLIFVIFETSARLCAQVERRRSGSRRAGIAPVVAQRRGSPRRHFGHKPWSPVERVNTT